MALDPSYFFYSEGTISLTNGSDIATGNFTAWDPAVLRYDFVFPGDGTAGMSVVQDVLAMDQIKLAKPWTGPTLTDVPYFIVRWIRHTDPRVYGVRVSEYLTRLKAIPDNIEEVAAEIHTDRQAVEAAMTLLSQIETNVDADRVAAQTAAGAAQTAQNGAQTAYNSLRSVFYGPYAADPTTRPDGSPIQEGDTYTRTTAPKGLRIFLNGAWTQAAVDAAGALLKANNLADLSNKDTALQNLNSAWKLLASPNPTGLTAIAVSIPAGTRQIRISGVSVATVASQPIGLRYSYDNGATYKSGGADYFTGFLLNNGAVGMSIGPAVSGDRAYLSIGSSDLAVVDHVDALIYIPSTSSVRASSCAQLKGFNATGHHMGFHNALSQTPGRPTHLLLFLASGTWTADTQLTVEARV
jgi:hypothetical protein